MNWKTAVSQIERLATAKGRTQTGLYAIEGIRLIERAVRAGSRPAFIIYSAHSLATSSERLTALMQQLDHLSILQVEVPDEELVRLTNRRSLGGIMGAVPFPKRHDFSEWMQQRKRALVLTAVDIIDPGNNGAMVRTALASGCDAVICVGKTDPFHPKAIRTSMGSLFKMPIIHFQTAEALLIELAHSDFLTVGTDVAGKRPLIATNFQSEKIALFMGNEFNGLPEKLLKKLTTTVKIPMPESVDSYSVNAATAIVLYEINRQNNFQQITSFRSY